MVILNKIRIILQIITSIILLFLVTTPVTQIILRLLSIPLIGAEEMSRFLLIALVFLGSPLAVWSGGHIAMDQVQMLFPRRFTRFLQVLLPVCSILVFGFLAVSGASLIKRMYANTSPALNLPFWVIMTPVAIGFLLLAIEYLVVFGHACKGGGNDQGQGSV